MQVIERQVLSLGIADFFVAVERVRDTTLRDRPVAIAPPGERSTIRCLSREARREGVYVGMPLREATRRCGGLRVLPPDPVLYGRAGSAIDEVVERYSPVVERGSGGRVYLDVTGMSGLFGPPVDQAARLSRELDARLRLPAAVGAAVNKLVSRVAAGLTEPRGVLDVRAGNETSFLEPLPVSRLPGVGTKISSRLAALNVRFVRQLALIETDHLTMAFGRLGIVLHQRSLGIDPRPVRPPRCNPEVRRERILTEDCNEPIRLRALWRALVDETGSELRQRNRAATQLICVLDYTDGRTDRRCLRSPFPLYAAGALRRVAEELFEQTRTRRVRIRRLIFVLSEWVRPSVQRTLFEDVEERRDRALSAAADRIRIRFGHKALQLAL